MCRAIVLSNSIFRVFRLSIFNLLGFAVVSQKGERNVRRNLGQIKRNGSGDGEQGRGVAEKKDENLCLPLPSFFSLPTFLFALIIIQ